MVVRILILAALLLVAPVMAGGIFAGTRKAAGGLLFRWVSGQMCLWAGFQLICVPMILRGQNLSDVIGPFSVYMAAVALFGIAADIKRRASAVPVGPPAEAGRRRDGVCIFLACCVAGMLLLQLAAACFLAYEEGDDAYYVAVSVTSSCSDTMYSRSAYTGLATGLDVRHGLSPMPVWVAFLARVSGIHAVTLAQVLLPVVLILMSYAIFYMIGAALFRGAPRKVLLFLLLIECLVLFGGYSVYTAENFLLVRTAQGKAVLAEIVIPFLFLLLLSWLEELEAGMKTRAGHWVLLALVTAAGCLCSLQGALLACLLLGIVGACMTASYRKWQLLLPMAGCCLVPVCNVVLYFGLA